VHGEFFGYLYHRDAMEDPSHRNYPQALKDVVGHYRNEMSYDFGDTITSCRSVSNVPRTRTFAEIG
jgi:hypothetical protein